MVPRRSSNKRKLLQLPYPENLLMTLLEGVVETIEVTPDIQAGLDYALSTLTEVEQEVLQLRFQNRLTYAEIGEIRERSDHAACSTENNAMRKLPHLSLRGYVLYGKEGFEAMDCVFHHPGETPPTLKVEPDPKVLLISFEELDLSVRSFNSLRRAGYEFVGDIVNLTYEQITNIRSFPRKNCLEVAYKLKALGLKDTCWKDFI